MRQPPEPEQGEQPTKQDSADIMIDRGEETQVDIERGKETVTERMAGRI